MPAPTNPYQPYADRFVDGSSKNCPTASAVVRDADVVGKWTDKIIIITGCTAGLGVETAKALHATGAKLYLTVRNLEKGKKVVEDIMSVGESKTPIELLSMDLSSLDSVRAAVKEFLNKEEKLNILVNNAGVMGCPFSLTTDGFEMHIGTNHFGHFMFFQLLKDTLLASSSPSFHSRVINVSSYGHRYRPIQFDDLNSQNEYNAFAAYGQSKTANIYMANSIESKYGSKGLHGLSLHPGVIVDTEMTRYISPEMLKALVGDPYFQKGCRTPQQGAATSVWAAVSPQLEGKGGVYLSDVGEAGPMAQDAQNGAPGYAAHVYDEEATAKLWKISYAMVGMEEQYNAEAEAV